MVFSKIDAVAKSPHGCPSGCPTRCVYYGMSNEPTAMIPPALSTLLAGLEVAEPMVCRNLVLVPLVSPARPEPAYLHLAEALGREGFTITEISQGGSVPDLRLVNNLDSAVLLLDGEELRGAKQNRTLNTTLLIAPRSETNIPVSCVERGRWRYESPQFSASHHISPSYLRRKKNRSVACSLQESKTHISDQGEVWEDVDRALGAMKVRSRTSAVADAYAAAENELRQFVAGIPRVPGQTGFIAIVDGEVAGGDVLCRPESFDHFRDQIVRSYAMEALVASAAAGTGELDELEDELREIRRRYDRVENGLEEQRRLLEKMPADPGQGAPDAAGGGTREPPQTRAMVQARIQYLERMRAIGAHDIADLVSGIERLRRQATEAAERGGGAGRSPDAWRAAARAFLGQAAGSKATLHATPGLGTDCRLQGDNLHGAALVVDDTVVHFSLFPTRPGEFRRARRMW